MRFGEAFLELTPQLSGSASTAVANAAGVAGRKAGEQFSDGFNRNADKMSVVGGFAKLAKGAGLAGKAAADNFNRQFGKGINEKSGALGQQLGIIGAKASIAGAGAAAAAPGLLQLTAALAPAAGAALALPGPLLAIKAATAVVKVAIQGVGDAITQGFTGKAEEATKALAKLPPEARKFATEIIKLKGPINALQADISDGLFAPLNREIGTLTRTYLPVAQKQLPAISSAIGNVGADLGKAATGGLAFKAVNSLLGNTAKSIEIAGKNSGLFVGAISSVIKVSADNLPRLATGFSDAATKASEFIIRAGTTGKLKEILDNGIDTLKTLGSILVNVGSIFKSVMQSASANGADLLTTLKNVTGQVAEFLKSTAGVEALAATFGAMAQAGDGIRTGLGAVLPALAQSAAIAGPVVGQLAVVAGDLLAAIAPLLPYFTQMAALILKMLIPAIAALAEYMAENEALMKIVATAVGAVVLSLRAYALAQGIATVATKVWAVATKAAAIVSNVWAAAQWALNAAMAANPIGVVVIAIVALVAALVLAYKNSETFRKIVDAAWKGIKVAIGAVADWFMRTVWPALKAAIDALGAMFKWLYNNVIIPVWGGIKAYIGLVWGILRGIFGAIEAYVRVLGVIFTWLWRNIITPVWNGIKLAIQVAWVPIRVLFGTIEIAVRGLAAIFTWLWRNVITPVWSGIRTVISAAWAWIRDNIFRPIDSFIRGTVTATWRYLSSVISSVWNAIRGAVSAAWSWVRNNVLDPLINFIRGPLVNAWNVAKAGITNAWNAIRGPLQATWNWVRENIFNRLSDFITKTIPNAFSTGVSAVGRAWDKVKEIARKPVEFVVNTVINNGIIKAFNAVAGFVGAGKIDPIKFAAGGVMPGYSPGRDVHKFMSATGGQLELSGGEGILRPELTRAIGTNFVHAGNAAARNGGTAGAKKFLSNFVGNQSGTARFKDGGIFGSITGAISSAWKAVTNPADTFKKIIGSVVNNIPGAGAFSNVLGGTANKLIDGVVKWITDKFNSSSAMVGGGGSETAGNWSGMRKWLLQRFPTATANPDTNRNDGGYHGMGRALDIFFSDGSERTGGGTARNAFNAIKGTFFKNIKELIWDFAGNQAVWNGQNHFFTGSGAGPGTHNDHIHWAMKNGGIFKYDNGGWLNPGEVGVNRGSRPEAVLTPAESTGLKNMGTGELIAKLEELIDEVKAIAPGVGGYIRGSGRGLITRSRAV